MSNAGPGIINIPIIKDVDVLIVGESSGAVEAALAAVSIGSKVFCVSRKTFLGHDICSYMNLWFTKKHKPQTNLSRKIFSRYFQDHSQLSLTEIKAIFEQELLKNGVEYLYSSYPTHLLKNEYGNVAGVVIANRSGFQAIRAKTIIDATTHAQVTRLTNVLFKQRDDDSITVSRTIVSNKIFDLPNVTIRKIADKVFFAEKEYMVYEYSTRYKLTDLSPASIAKIEQQALLDLWNPESIFLADDCSLPPLLRMESGHKTNGYIKAEHLQAGTEQIYILSGCADVAHSQLEQFSNPCRLMGLGKSLGKYVATKAKSIIKSDKIEVCYCSNKTLTTMTISRKDTYFRYIDKATLELNLNRIPTLGGYDVVVGGGGTAGAPAGISAGRQGVSTLVCEYVPMLGGVSTAGRISGYWYGFRGGFTKEIDLGVAQMGDNPEFLPDDGKWNIYWKSQWYLQELSKNNVDVWFNSTVVAAATKNDTLTGLVIATPYGWGLVSAKSVIDASGNSDIAAAAGVRTVNISREHLAIQGTGLSPVIAGQHNSNSDYTFIDDCDVLDVTRGFTVAREKFRHNDDICQIINSRQRQQIVGEITLNPADFITGRNFKDTIAIGYSNFDSHGFTIHPIFMLKPLSHNEPITAKIPYRALLPVGLDGVLVTGLGISCHRDALPVIRMQADVQNQGYAVGYASALAVKSKTSVATVDVRVIQQHLLEVGILNESLIVDKDTAALTETTVVEIISQKTDSLSAIAIMFEYPDICKPILRKLFVETKEPDKKLFYAQVMGYLGDNHAGKYLAKEISMRSWDKGWEFTGMHQFGACLSELDNLIIAFGRSGYDQENTVLLEKLSALKVDSEFSHFRAVALAFIAIGKNTEAAKLFSDKLKKTGNHSQHDILKNAMNTPKSFIDTTERNHELKEIYIARALLACGDYNSNAQEVLTNYVSDLHGHYVKHAMALLKKEYKSKSKFLT